MALDVPNSDGEVTMLASQRQLRAPSSWRCLQPELLEKPWVAIVSSRLNKPLEAQRAWFQALQCSVLRAKRQAAALLVISGTTTADWIRHASRLYGVPIVEIEVNDPKQRDSTAIMLADRVIALHLREGGNIEQAILQRLTIDAPEPCVWVVAPDRGPKSWHRCVTAGAILWRIDYQQNCLHSATATATDLTASTEKVVTAALYPLPDGLESGQWLIHCTRSRSGALPGQNQNAWRDEVLLGGRLGQHWTAKDVLVEILRSQRLRGHRLNKDSPPVVCFAAVGLFELLGRRTYRPHLGRWDYEPFGIAFRQQALSRCGALPVIYGPSADRQQLPAESRWRFQAQGKTYDWTTEKEWRVCGSVDLSAVSDEDAVVFIGSSNCAREVSRYSRWPVILSRPTRYNAVSESPRGYAVSLEEPSLELCN